MGRNSVVSSYCTLIIIRQLFVYTLFTGERRESIKEKVLLKCSYFTFLIDIFEDNHNIERDLFERDSVINVMKNRLLVAKNARKFQFISTWLSHISKPWKLSLGTNNDLMTWKSIRLMLLVIYNDLMKSNLEAFVGMKHSTEAFS